MASHLYLVELRPEPRPTCFCSPQHTAYAPPPLPAPHCHHHQCGRVGNAPSGKTVLEETLWKGTGREKTTWSCGLSVAPTLLWAQMAEPRSFQVPPLRSIRSMRRICRKRRLRRDVARTLPWLPTATTGTEAISTKMSGREDKGPVTRAV